MKTNSLIFKCSKVAADGTQYDITVRLDDEGKNGHADFSITGTSYAAGKIKCERNSIRSGAIGDAIAAAFPEFAIFNRLHLCDFDGAPMYALSNGYYHLKRMQTAEFCAYFNCTPAERDAFVLAENEAHFAILLNASDVPARWKADADAAIKLLEEWTGKEFVNDSTRRNFIAPAPAEVEEYARKVAEGYYTPEAKKQRADKQAADARAVQFAAIEKERAARIAKADQEYKVKRAVLTAGLPLDNFIYYDHTATGVFNWKDYGEKITPEQFAAAALAVDGVTFQLKK
jgi:hypothetical protein